MYFTPDMVYSVILRKKNIDKMLTSSRQAFTYMIYLYLSVVPHHIAELS